MLALSHTRLADPAIAQLQQNIVIRQEEGSIIAEPTDSFDDSDTATSTTDISTDISTDIFTIFATVTTSSSSSAPTSSGAIISPGIVTATSSGTIIPSGIVTPTSTSVEAPILTTTSPTPTAISAKDSSGGLSKGAAAGIAIGVIIGVIALAAGAFLLWRRQKSRWANNTAVANDTSHDYPESGEAESRAKTAYAFDGDAFAAPKQTPIPTTSAVEDVSSLPELVSIANEQGAREGARQESAKSATRKDQTVSHELSRLEDEERQIAAAIADAEHLERLRIEQRAVQSRIQEARGGQT